MGLKKLPLQLENNDRVSYRTELWASGWVLGVQRQNNKKKKIYA